jgi:tol-pal system protein YbgF
MMGLPVPVPIGPGRLSRGNDFFQENFMKTNQDNCIDPRAMTVTSLKEILSKRHAFFISFLIIFLFPLFACVPESEVINLNDQIVALNKKVNKLEESQRGTDKQRTRETDSELEAIRSSQASNSADLEQMKVAIDAQSGRIEDMEHVVKRVVERDLSGLDDMRTELTLMTQKVSELEMMVKQQQDYLHLERPATTEKREPIRPPTTQKESAPNVAVIPPRQETSELSLYDSSLATYREGKYQEAMEGFQDFLKRYPKSDLADNAYFWIGESYMALGRYEQAILSYQEVIKKFPTGNKVPSALLRQAIAFVEIKDEMSAKLLLQKIIKNYPSSSEAKIAQTKLKSLGK